MLSHLAKVVPCGSLVFGQEHGEGTGSHRTCVCYTLQEAGQEAVHRVENQSGAQGCFLATSPTNSSCPASNHSLSDAATTYKSRKRKVLPFGTTAYTWLPYLDNKAQAKHSYLW